MHSDPRNRLLTLARCGDLAAAEALERWARRHEDTEALAVSLCVVDLALAERYEQGFDLDATEEAVHRSSELDEMFTLRWWELCELVEADAAGDVAALSALLDRFWPDGPRELLRSWLATPPSSGALELARTVILDDAPVVDDLRALLTAGHLAQLSVIEAVEADDELCRLLAEATHLRGLRWLDLQGPAITDCGLQWIASARHLASLERLRLEYAFEIGAAGFEALANAGHLRNLRELVLDDAHWEAAMRHLPEAVFWPELTRLTLNDDVDCTALPLPGRPTADRLEILSLDRENFELALELMLEHRPVVDRLVIHDSGLWSLNDRLMRLFELAPMRQVSTLELDEDDLGDEIIVRLAEMAWVRSLRVLRLRGNDIGTCALEALARSPHLEGLVELDLRGAPLDADAKVTLDAWAARRPAMTIRR